MRKKSRASGCSAFIRWYCCMAGVFGLASSLRPCILKRLAASESRLGGGGKPSLRKTPGLWSSLRQVDCLPEEHFRVRELLEVDELGAGADHGADHRVEPGAVAAPGEDPDLLRGHRRKYSLPE